MSSVFARIHALAGERPAKSAVIVVDGGVTKEVDYQKLVLDVESCAKGLVASGIRSGDTVAVIFPNSYEFVVAVLAVFAVGGRLLPLNPGFRIDEIDHCLDSGDTRAVFYPCELESVSSYIDVKRISGFCGIDLPSGETDKLPDNPESAHSGIYMFSSGSTGKSKRISRSQQDILSEYDMLARTLSLTDAEVIYCTVPMYHAHGFANALMSALLSGSTLVISSNEFNARKTVQLLEDYAVTIFPAVPFMLKIFAMTNFSPAPKLSALRFLISAGAPMDEDTCLAMVQKFGIRVAQLYGSTETGAMTINLSGDNESLLSVGRPLAGVRMEIRDEAGRSLPEGKEGEVWVSSPAMTTRYDNMPELSHECFVDGWFFAGDLGRIDVSGRLYILGRKKNLIIFAANKVDPLEVESCLKEHPDIEDAVVVGEKHSVYGEIVKAYVVTDRADKKELETILCRFVSGKLAEYKAPAKFEFITEIPRSPLGKVLRKYL